MKNFRFGILALGTSLFSLPGCTGEAFTAFDDPGSVDASTDASSDAAPSLDAGKDAQDASNDVDTDALDDASTDGEADATADADAGDPDDGGGDGDAPDGDAGDVDDAGGGDANTEEDAGDGEAGADDDAGVDGGSGGCNPLIWYQDLDHDGWGNPFVSIASCEHPGEGWTSQKGDCNDTNAEVHPGQEAFFTEAYLRPGTSEFSFDYDCDGKEEGDGKPTTSEASCKAESIGKCAGSGYLPVNPTRPGASVNQFCGSTTLRTCTPILNLLGCEPPKLNNSADPLGCR